MEPVAGALKIGTEPDSGDWWQNSADDVTTRACYFDDKYVFGEDGSFQNIQGDKTWLISNSVPNGLGYSLVHFECGTPPVTHNGTNTATYYQNTESLTINGAGSYIGIYRCTNGGILDDLNNAPDEITYNVLPTGDRDKLKLTIKSEVRVELAPGDIAVVAEDWTFTLVKEEEGTCMTGDTLINTNEGLVEIQHLKRGDMILTNNGYQPLNMLVICDDHEPHPTEPELNRFIKFPKGCLGENIPSQDLYLTTYHPLVFGEKKVRAKDFVNKNLCIEYVYRKSKNYNLHFKDIQYYQIYNVDMESHILDTSYKPESYVSYEEVFR
jgi:hypothetical protein